MLTLTCNSSVNRHFLPVPHEPSPEPELSETNRAENPESNQDELESGPEARINRTEPSLTELNRTSSQPQLSRAERQVNQGSHVLFDYFNTLFVFCFYKKECVALKFYQFCQVWYLKTIVDGK